MTDATPLDSAEQILGPDVLGARAVAEAYGVDAAPDAAVPFSRQALSRARSWGAFLVYRLARDHQGQPLTVVRLRELVSGAIDEKSFAGVGYQLKTEWTLDREVGALAETCRPGWALVSKRILDVTRNLTYPGQETALRRWAEAEGLEPAHVGRRRLVEIVHDTLAYWRLRETRLLEGDWDLSLTPSTDGSQLTAGEFDSGGLKVLAYSWAVRFGTLGVCANVEPAAGAPR